MPSMAMEADDYVGELRSFFNEIGEKYNQGHMGDWHVKAADILVTAAGKSITEGAWVLDLATGTGNVAFAAARKVGPSGRVVGVDISDNFLSIAAESAVDHGLEDRITFLNQDVMHLSVPDVTPGSRPFDVIFCGSALPLFPDPSTVVQYAAKHLLKRGGTFVADMHGNVPANVFYEQAQKLNIKTPTDPIWFLDMGSALRSLFERTGFEVTVQKLDHKHQGMRWDVSSPEAVEGLWDRMILKAPWASFGFDANSEELAKLKIAWSSELIKMGDGDGIIEETTPQHLALATNKL